MYRCCFCDAPVSRVFLEKGSFIPDFCLDCKKQNDELLGVGWEKSEWHRETVRMSRRLALHESRELFAINLSAPNAPQISAEAVQRPGQTSEELDRLALNELIHKILSSQPNIGWRRVQKALIERGIAITTGRVKSRLRAIRRESGNTSPQ